jgi:hypothetical protein
MQYVDIDRLCGCGDVPSFPTNHESPVDRNIHYHEYRDLARGLRNPHMFQQANWALHSAGAFARFGGRGPRWGTSLLGQVMFLAGAFAELEVSEALLATPYGVPGPNSGEECPT